MNLRLDMTNIIGGDGRIVSSDVENAEELNIPFFTWKNGDNTII